ncbi:MAG TPA: hypothetical protein PLK98_02450 [Methanothrix sp.]|jgi:hypothetical protein|nr:hypothetical protein [Methanothrix sp.]HNU39495.1 hypothetical protein [Methanothrix sp.]HPH48357.1 hypothetical protein [Methanothrix sp.]
MATLNLLPMPFPAANLLGNLVGLYDLFEDNGSISQMIHGD